MMLARIQKTWPRSNMSNCDILFNILVIIDFIKKKMNSGLYVTKFQKTSLKHMHNRWNEIELCRDAKSLDSLSHQDEWLD
jgi:hypothetical protein